MYDLVIKNATVVPVSAPGLIPNAAMAIANGRIAFVGSQADMPRAETTREIDARGMVVVPGFVDCHTHLMEYAVPALHHARGRSHWMGAMCNLMTALKAGVTTLGEHHLGHPLLSFSTGEYLSVARGLPVGVYFATGCCVLGTEPMVGTSAATPGQTLDPGELDAHLFASLADASDFPGENIFVTATVANLPPHLVPLAGRLALSDDQIETAIAVFHGRGKRIGAHVEGTEAVERFVELGGDVIHHGHGAEASLATRLAQRGVPVVVTTHGGTSHRPTSPSEVVMLVEAGVTVAIATDSYLPLHPAATWVDADRDVLLGPDSLMSLCSAPFRALRKRGHDISTLLATITLNPARIMGIDAEVGSLDVGKRADLLIATEIPGLETTAVEDLMMVIKDGIVEIDRMNA